MSHHQHQDDEHQDEHQDDESQGDESQENGGQQMTEAPEVTDEHKEKAAEMRKSYDDTRPTAVMPGTDRTITGTAVNEWLDDEGNPKFGDDKSQEGESQEGESQESQEATENG